MSSIGGGRVFRWGGMVAGRRRRKVVFIVGASAVERERVAATVRSTADEVRQCITLGEVDAALIKESAAVIVIAPDQTPTPCECRRFVASASKIPLPLSCYATGKAIVAFISLRRSRGQGSMTS